MRYARLRQEMTTTLGMGVVLLMEIMVSAPGIWPSLAPEKNNLEDVSNCPLTAPKVEQATKMGMIQAILPYSRLANVTATASEPRTSGTLRVVWNATIVST